MANLWTHIVNPWRQALKLPLSKVTDLGDAIAAVQALQEQGAARFFIVVDAVDSSVEVDMLEAIMRFPALAHAPIGVIFLSATPWRHLFTNMPAPEPKPREVHFPAYRQEELMSILAAARPSCIPTQVYESFLNAYIRPACRITRQLRDVQALERELRPHVEAAVATAGPATPPAAIIAQVATKCKDLDATFSERYPGPPVDIREEVRASSGGDSGGVRTLPPEVLSLEVSHVGKFLLLAAFVCANNQGSADKKLFTAKGESGRRRKAAQAMDRQGETSTDMASAHGQVRAPAACCHHHAARPIPLAASPVQHGELWLCAQAFTWERWLQICWQLLQIHAERNVGLDDTQLADLHFCRPRMQLLVLAQHLIRTRFVNLVRPHSLVACPMCIRWIPRAANVS